MSFTCVFTYTKEDKNDSKGNLNFSSSSLGIILMLSYCSWNENVNRKYYYVNTAICGYL